MKGLFSPVEDEKEYDQYADNYYRLFALAMRIAIDNPGLDPIEAVEIAMGDPP